MKTQKEGHGRIDSSDDPRTSLKRNEDTSIHSTEGAVYSHAYHTRRWYTHQFSPIERTHLPYALPLTEEIKHQETDNLSVFKDALCIRSFDESLHYLCCGQSDGKILQNIYSSRSVIF